MAPIDVVQAQSQAATQRQNLAVAEGTRRANELALKRLIVAGTQDPNWAAAIDPGGSAGIRACADRRRRRRSNGRWTNRTDLQQARKNLQVNDVTLKYLNNQTLPQADLRGPLRPDRPGRRAVHRLHRQRRQPVRAPAPFPAAMPTR